VAEWSYLIPLKMLTTTMVATAMESAQASALPGHQACERISVMRELWQLLRHPSERPDQSPPLRLAGSTPSARQHAPTFPLALK
jgi:hypothetical protein